MSNQIDDESASRVQMAKNETNNGVALERGSDILTPRQATNQRIEEEDQPLPLVGGVPHEIKNLDQILAFFYENNLYMSQKRKNHELEIRFGTTQKTPITRTEYDNVIKTLKSMGFETTNHFGTPSLRIRNEFVDPKKGTVRMSSVRTEIYGLPDIEAYCRSNDLRTIFTPGSSDDRVVFLSKTPFIMSTKARLPPISVDDFHFRASLQVEERASFALESQIVEKWTSSKKEFRYVNRVSFTHPDYPASIDISITKSGTKKRTAQGGWMIVPASTVSESNVFNNAETYEIEIEVDNARLASESHWTSDTFVASMKKVIKYVLMGLQKTPYPISYPEQEAMLVDYMKLVWGKEYDVKRHERITPRNFIGPNSVTLQRPNIAPIDSNTLTPNVRKDFVVTEKADGERHLLFITKRGRVYLISSNMDVLFTGVVTKSAELREVLIDGELISHDKSGRHLNLYAAFDIYIFRGEDVRALPFISNEDNERTRYSMLVKFKKERKWTSVIASSQGGTTEAALKFSIKQFYPRDPSQSIFVGCERLLQKTFEYETDGLIFTHRTYGVGGNAPGKVGPKTKITWDHSFKWKPPQYNTIDFLVTFKKDSQGTDIVKPIYEGGISMSEAVQFNEYKILELRCGFNEKTDGYINPCQMIIEGRGSTDDSKSGEYMPRQFYPTNPTDPNAGICHLMMRQDEGGTSQLFSEEGDVISDNTIVEFSYDINKPTFWNWVPLRVRFDKTARLRRGEKEYGNSYKVCNENWRSIHPSGRITQEMLMSGEGIPDVEVAEDVYYNTPSGEMQTVGLKNFHNLFVKKRLIVGTTKPGNTLIDFACGKAGDLPKWVSAKLSFVFGVDYSPDNIDNRLDGACARYLKLKRTTRQIPDALFVQGNSSQSIRTGAALRTEKDKQISDVIFGNMSANKSGLGKGVTRHAGVGRAGFSISSCQFALHYFFQNPETLVGFVKNVAECTQINGYFIGTAYDGERIFRKLQRTDTGGSIQINHNDKKIWEIVKHYSHTQFPTASGSIGMRISVFQESINQYIDEYLINFSYFIRVMENFGFVVLGDNEALDMHLPSGMGNFKVLFDAMENEIKTSASEGANYGKALMMSEAEKEVSFLNTYFVFKKIREIDPENVVLDMSEFHAIHSPGTAITSKQVVFNVQPTTRRIKLRPIGE